MRERRTADRARADRPWQEVAFGGGLSGLVSGLLMAVAAMAGVAAAGMSPWLPLRLVGGTFYGADAIGLGAEPVIVGAALHLLVSVFWAVLFAFTVRPDTPTAGSLTTGLVYAVVVWALMTFTLVPWLDPLLATRLEDVGVWWFLLHLVWGAGLSVTPAMERLASGGTLSPPRPL